MFWLCLVLSSGWGMLKLLVVIVMMANSMEWLRTDEWRMESKMMWFGCTCFLYHLDSFPWSNLDLRMMTILFDLCESSLSFALCHSGNNLRAFSHAAQMSETVWLLDVQTGFGWFRWYIYAISRRIASWEIPQREYNAPTMLSYRIPIDGQHLLGAQFSMMASNTIITILFFCTTGAPLQGHV